MNIAEFLEARIVEDEHRLDYPGFVEDHDSARGPGWGNVPGSECFCGKYFFDGIEEVVEESWWAHAETAHGRTRVLAECAAKRAIVAEHELVPQTYESRRPVKYDVGCEICAEWDGLITPDGPCRTLRHLAAVYDQHPDYDQAWRNA